ncbi:diguanylate cyclase (GGDEF)-like protein/PAS domain S-box-containing protein [Desulfitispora alkaliphila]|uniref:EAL domain-containing protein n=1 Tax=Desulfitispora alkaliphila TaxID=622674 RepID=UPI003D20A16A
MSGLLTSDEKPVVLVVDDSKYIRMTLVSIMLEEGYQVLEAENGKEAIEISISEMPDIILMDCVMPELTGITACKRINENSSTQHIPVIMITSLADEKTVEDAFDAGAIDYLTKPINYAVLKKRVGRILKARITEQTLDKSEVFSNTIINNALDGIITIDDQGRILSINPSAERIFQYRSSEIIGGYINKIIPKIYCQQDITTEDMKELSQTNFNETDVLGKKKNGETFPIELSISDCYLGKQLIFTIIFRDISKRRQYQKDMLESRERYRTLTENTYDLISEIGINGEFIYTSPNYKEVLGYDVTDLLGIKYHVIIHPEDLPIVATGLKKYLYGEAEQIVARFIHKNGEVRLFESTGKAYKTAQGETRIVFVSRDITERKHYEDRLWHQAFHDALTNLPNRTLLKDRLQVEINHAKRNGTKVGVLFLDLDRFKIINDTLGHAIGDKLLQTIADRIVDCVRTDDTVARLGGDEFTVLVTSVNRSEDVAKVAEKILKAVKQPMEIDGNQLYLTASIGIAIYPDDGVNVTNILKNADAAMYRAKESGRNNYQLYTYALNEKAFERLEMENSLRRAIEQEEFEVYYQPRINVTNGQIIGMEALIRWNHPDWGLVSPGRFITIAEETGLIVPIGEWVLRAACAQNKAWQEAGHKPVRMAVNISARQFQLQDFLRVVADVLEQTGLEPRWLELEITESIAMQNVDYTYKMLRKLNEMGIDLSIDDFGTGYSSLSYLKRFPINKLKIDKSFVNDITSDENNAAIASTVIVLGKSLKFGVVAEGVETKEQLDFLREHNCEEMQGYYFGKPVPAENFWEKLKEEIEKKCQGADKDNEGNSDCSW